MVYAFDWMERRFREQKVFVRILRLTTEGSGLSSTILEELQKRKKSGCGSVRVLWEMCQEGKERGEIREDIPISAACITLLANMAAFVMYLEKNEQMPEINTAWMKKFLCNGLLNQLNTAELESRQFSWLSFCLHFCSCLLAGGGMRSRTGRSRRRQEQGLKKQRIPYQRVKNREPQGNRQNL